MASEPVTISCVSPARSLRLALVTDRETKLAFEAVATIVAVRLLSGDAGSFALEVRVRGGGTETIHSVALQAELLARLSPGESPEDFVRRCFEFLLEREPKESILRHFDVAAIGGYFPEFESRIAGP
jgi:hypothetical protein